MRLHYFLKTDLCLAGLVLFSCITLTSCNSFSDVLRKNDYVGYIWEAKDPKIYFNCSKTSPLIGDESFEPWDASDEQLRESYLNITIDEITYRCDIGILESFLGWKKGDQQTASFLLTTCYDDNFGDKSSGKILLRGSIFLYDYIDDVKIYTKKLKLVSDTGYFLDKYKEEGKESPYSTIYIYGRYVG